MNIFFQSISRPTSRKVSPYSHLAHSQHGVVLIIALVILIVISLLAATSIRNASSTISVSGNVRTTELANQAAEIALQHCERSVLQVVTVEAGGSDHYVTTFQAENIFPEASPPNWQNKTVWDSTPSKVYSLPLSMVNQAGMVATTYRRAPECMVERIVIAKTVAKPMPGEPGEPDVPAKYDINPDSGADPDSSFLVTARGFGPEVERGAGRPVGSEFWLQSQIKIRYFEVDDDNDDG